LLSTGKKSQAKIKEQCPLDEKRAVKVGWDRFFSVNKPMNEIGIFF